MDRYSHNPALYAWQVENEPFNRAGPHQWWIDSNFVHQEVLTVKRLDSRPVILTAFGSFNLVVDRGSGHRGLSLSSLLGFDTDGAEQESLGSIGKGDIFGLDVYNRIGFRLLGRDLVSSAGRDWSSRATAWVGRAERQRKDAWVTELQAEPWEASPVSYAHPKSISPRGVVTNFHAVADGGYDTVLLWGSEYWLWRARHGDNRWVRAVGAILRQESNAAPLKPGLKRA